MTVWPNLREWAVRTDKRTRVHTEARRDDDAHLTYDTRTSALLNFVSNSSNALGNVSSLDRPARRRRMCRIRSLGVTSGICSIVNRFGGMHIVTRYIM